MPISYRDLEQRTVLRGAGANYARLLCNLATATTQTGVYFLPDLCNKAPSRVEIAA